MIRLGIRGLLARKLRTGLTMVAIVLGVSMVSGTYILTDTIHSSFDHIFKQATRDIDAVVVGKAIVQSQFSPIRPLPASLLPIVRRVPGVAAADGEIADQASIYTTKGRSLASRRLRMRRRVGASGGAPSLLFAVGQERFNELTLVKGRWPHGNQIALDESTMSRNRLHVGEVLEVGTITHALSRFAITGETRFGSVGSIGGATLIDMDLATAQRMTGKIGEYDQIAVMATKGVSPAEVVKRIKAVIPTNLRYRVKVQTGEQNASTSASQIGDALNFLTIGLLVFAGIAIFVGAFIIFNTFSITVAQRAREFALLRTLGASRAQILRAVVAEALLIGLLASIIGMVAGLGIAKLLNGLFSVFGADLPSNGLVVEIRTVLVALVVGSLVTVCSGLMPALRATRVPPIAALTASEGLPRGRLARYTPYTAALVITLGLLLTVDGVLASISSAGTRLSLIGGGCILLFLGVAMFSPRLVRPLAMVVSWPIDRLTSITGRIARDNSTRNPSRTAVTAAALMVGLALVSFVTIFAAELRRTAEDAVSREIAGTYIVENQQSNFNSIPPGAVADIAALGGVSLVSPLKQDAARIDGVGTAHVDGIDTANFGRVYRFQWVHGSGRTLASLGSNGMLIDDGVATSHRLHQGSRLSLLTTNGIPDSFVVRGVYKSSQILANYLIPIRTFARDWRQPNDLVLLVNAAPHANQRVVENRIANVLTARYPDLSVSSQQQFKSQTDSQVNSLLALIYVLLGLSIVVSLFGIVNTLVLSIYERTREIGLLRVIGTSRSQIRWMIRWESVITALIGAILGLVLGIVLAVVITAGLQSQGIEFALPVGQLLVWLVVAIVFGIAAAAFPARRAARLDMLTAIAYE